ncbi:Diphosphomevalonate decarboxylase [Exaiptasia diaphana]|nr:Diphosphomevalonate decarboxylase [Exaiptasia diaphana]
MAVFLCAVASDDEVEEKRGRKTLTDVIKELARLKQRLYRMESRRMILLKGRDGRDGKDGIPGPQGRDGRDGKNGARGPKGPRGPQGPSGSHGPRGPPGPSGGGIEYIRWGKTSCPSGANIVYKEILFTRQGSGSACRSMYGGFVAWLKGESDDGHDSIAKQIRSDEHWKSLRILVLVVNDQKKSTPSTVGMKRSVETSDLLQLRAKHCVDQRMNVMEQAILDKDFETFAELTMKESNQLHAVCQDTYPPIEPPYINSISHSIIQLVTAFNQHYGTNKVAYTFDAGPNAVLFLQENNVASFLSWVNWAFPPDDPHSFIKGIPISPIPDLSTTNEKISTNISGRIGGESYGHLGGGANYVCVPEVPDYLNYKPGRQNTAFIFGTDSIANL